MAHPDHQLYLLGLADVLGLLRECSVPQLPLLLHSILPTWRILPVAGSCQLFRHAGKTPVRMGRMSPGLRREDKENQIAPAFIVANQF